MRPYKKPETDEKIKFHYLLKQNPFTLSNVAITLKNKETLQNVFKYLKSKSL